MTSPMLFYRDQAARQQGEADAATLENVRERCQRAADAWTELADRIERNDARRASRDPAPVVEQQIIDTQLG